MNKNTKIFLTFIPLVLLGPVAMDIYLPILPKIQSDFEISTIETQWTLSIFVMSFGLFQILVGLVANKYGTHHTLFVSIIVFIFSTMLCTFTQKIGIFLIGRFLQAASSCCCMVLCLATSRNISSRYETSVQVYSVLSGCTGFAPVIAPLIGGLIVEYLGTWQHTFYFQALLATIGMMILIKNKKVIPFDPHTHYRHSITDNRNYASVIKDLHFWNYTIFGAASMSILFTFFSVIQYILLEEFYVDIKYLPFIFSICAIGFVCGNFCNALIAKKINVYSIVLFSYTVILLISFIMIVLKTLVASIQILTLFMLCINFFVALSFGSSMAGAMKNFQNNSAIAASIYGFLQFFAAFFIATALVACDFKSQHCLVLVIFVISAATICISFIIKNKLLNY